MEQNTHTPNPETESPEHHLRFRVRIEVTENLEALEKLQEETGCFVLLTSVSDEKKSGKEILEIYKEQDGVEKNFGFLKDPLIVNDVFLNKPHRSCINDLKPCRGARW